MLAISGEDLVVLGAPRGPRIGELLEMLYTALVRKEIENKREAMIGYIKRYI